MLTIFHSKLQSGLILNNREYLLLILPIYLGSLPATGPINPSVLKSILGVITALRPYWKSMQLCPVLPTLPSPDDLRLMQNIYPSLEFHPPPGFPPETFPTSDYYLVFDAETEKRLALEIAKVYFNLSPSFSFVEEKLIEGK